MIAYLIFLITRIGMLTVLSQSYNLMLGYTGIFSMGHVGTIAIGAYTSAILSLQGIPVWLSMLIGMALCAGVGFLLGFPTLRLKGHYLALATLGMSEIIRLIALNWVSLTNGPLGITRIPKPSLFGITFDSDLKIMTLYLVIAFLVNYFLYRLIHSPYGKVLQAIREDEVAAESLGKNVFRYKMQVLVLGAALAGLEGAMYAHAYSYIDPTLFVIPEMVWLLTMTVLGGLGNFWGGIIGPIAIFLIYEPLRYFAIPPQILGPLRFVIYGIILILIILFRPQGIMGRLKHFHRKFK